MSDAPNTGVILSAAATLLRACLRLYPRRFRLDYGSEMETVFVRRMIRARSAGLLPMTWALLAAFQDVLTGAMAARLPVRRTAQGDSMLSTRSPEVVYRYIGIPTAAAAAPT